MSSYHLPELYQKSWESSPARSDSSCTQEFPENELCPLLWDMLSLTPHPQRCLDVWNPQSPFPLSTLSLGSKPSLFPDHLNHLHPAIGLALSLGSPDGGEWSLGRKW